MSYTNKMHYIPVVYQKQFSSETNDYLVYGRKNNDGSIKVLKTVNLTGRGQFKCYHWNDRNPIYYQSTEKFHEKFESKYKDIVNRLSNGEINDKDFVQLYCFIINMLVRHPRTLKTFEKTIKNELSDKKLNNFFVETCEKYNRPILLNELTQFKVDAKRKLSDSIEYWNKKQLTPITEYVIKLHIEERRWFIGTNKTNIPLITSDRPIKIYDGNVFIPLSKKIYLGIVNNNIENDALIYYVNLNDENVINQLNSSQIDGFEKYLIGGNNKEWLENIMVTNKT